MEKTLDVSIIIVNFNTREVIKNCLKSIFEKTKNIDFEVIVSDNGSSDGSVEMIRTEFPQVILIENNANLGFGAANNRGLKIAKGKYIFYLNSDTVLLNNAVKIFFDFWKNSPEKDRLGALGCNLVDADGKHGTSAMNFPYPKISTRALLFCICKSFISKNVWSRFVKTRNFTQKNSCVDAIIGADLFLKNNSDAEFNELFFLYCEEVELQYRLFKKNKIRKIIDTPRIVHLEGASDSKIGIEKFYSFTKKRNVREWQSRKIFFDLHFKHSFWAVLFNVILFCVYIMPWNCGEKLCNFKAVLLGKRI